MKSVFFGLVGFGALAVCSSAGLAQDVITDWNQELLETIRVSNTAPPIAARAMAMVHTAAFEAVNSIDRHYRPYVSYYSCPTGTNKEAAAAVAARNVMAALFPARTAEFDSKLAAQLGAMPDGPGKTEGITLGNAAAAGMLARRQDDGGSASPPAIADGTLPGQWRRTGPGYADPALPHWAGVKPFSVSSSTQFDPGPAPTLDSASYLAAYNEVKELGSLTSATRTAHQTDTALLWKAGSNSVTPPGQWNEIAQQVAITRNQSLEENARMFALLGMAVADAGITAWDAKYEDLVWRPITGIQLGEADGVAGTVGDAGWQPLLTTPNHPTYVSGHSTFSSAAAGVLTQFWGTDSVQFTVTGDGVTRNYTSLADAMNDAGMSRIYGGIHWQFDNTAGIASGLGIGAWVAGNTLSVPAPTTGALLLVAGVMGLRRRR